MKEDRDSGKLSGFILVSIIAFIVFSLGFFPIIIGGYYVLLFIPFNELWHLFLLPFLFYIGFSITLFYQVLISGLVIHIFTGDIYELEESRYPVYIYCQFVSMHGP